jgi:hypothetical protein
MENQKQVPPLGLKSSVGMNRKTGMTVREW